MVRGGRSRNKGRSLFERLRADDLELRSDTQDELSERIRSIKANLVHVLNGHVGTSQSAPGFGMLDMNDAAMRYEDLLSIISSDVRRAIRDFEPRISDVRVNFDRSQNAGDALYFRVSAKIRIGHSNEMVAIDLVMKGGRRFNVA